MIHLSNSVHETMWVKGPHIDTSIPTTGRLGQWYPDESLHVQYRIC